MVVLVDLVSEYIGKSRPSAHSVGQTSEFLCRQIQCPLSALAGSLPFLQKPAYAGS